MALMGVAVAGIGAVLLWAQIEAAPAPDGSAANLDRAAVQAPATQLATPRPAAAMARAAPASEPVQAARIEDMAATPVAASSPASTAASEATASPFDQLASMPAATVASSAGVDQARPAKKAAPQRSRNEPAARAARAAPAAKATPSSRATGHSPSRAPAQAAAGQPTGQSDADVEIMAALIGHMNESNAASGTADASIADLVRHCRSLPGAEAQACQRRICQGYWGRAEACPRDRQGALRMAGSTAP